MYILYISSWILVTCFSCFLSFSITTKFLEHVWQFCAPSKLSVYKGNCTFSSWCEFTDRNIVSSLSQGFLCTTFITFPPSLPTKDSIDMPMHLKFRELIDWMMDHNELSLFPYLWGQWNPLSGLSDKREKDLTSHENLHYSQLKQDDVLCWCLF